MPTVFVGADLRIVDRDSNDLGAQYSRNQVMVSVGYTPARSRDYSIIPEREAGAPAAPRAQGVFSGFYAGAQLGHGGLTTATFGPRDGGGSDATTMGGFGASYGLFAGWGTEINNWTLGLEIDAGDSDAGWYHKKDKGTAPTVFVDKDDSVGLSARVGYLLDGGLLYGKLGAVRTRFHTYDTDNNNVAGAYDQKHRDTGTRIGLGLEVPASRNLFVRTDYSLHPLRRLRRDLPIARRPGHRVLRDQRRRLQPRPRLALRRRTSRGRHAFRHRTARPVRGRPSRPRHAGHRTDRRAQHRQCPRPHSPATSPRQASPAASSPATATPSTRSTSAWNWKPRQPTSAGSTSG